MQALHLKNFERLLGDNDWFVGKKTSVADMAVYDVLSSQCLNLIPGCLDAFPKLKAFVERVDALPSIAAYKASDAFKKLNNPHEELKLE